MDDTKTSVLKKEDLAKDHLGDAMQRLARESVLEDKMFDQNPLEPENMEGGIITEIQETEKSQENLGQIFENYVQREEEDKIKSAQARLEVQTSQDQQEKIVVSSEKDSPLETVKAPSVGSKEAYIAKIIEDVKVGSQSQTVVDDTNITSTSGDWLSTISETERPQKCLNLIISKGKNIEEVVKAFLELNDLSGLDSLESLLSQNYEQLVHAKILPKV